MNLDSPGYRGADLDISDKFVRCRRTASCSTSSIAPNFSGGDGVRATPVPIPNTAVKPHSVDGTAALQLWESRTLPDLNSKPASNQAGFFLECGLCGHDL